MSFDTEFKTVVTAIGLAKFQNSVFLGQEIILSHLAVGDIGGQPNVNMVALRREVWRGPINRVALNPSEATEVQADGYIQSAVGGFHVREAALIDEDGDVIAIGNVPETYKAKLTSGGATDMLIRFVIRADNSEQVTLKIDPAIIMASQAWVHDQILPAYLMACVNALDIDKIKHP